MSLNSRLTATLTSTILMLGGAGAYASQSTKHEAQELHRAKLSLIEAVIAAEKQGGGRATSGEFVFKKGNPAYFEIKVLRAAGGKLTRYDLDPKTGDVQKPDNEALEKLLTRIKIDDLRG